MRLNGAIVADNARAWQRRAGVPLRAVVKSDGYGWGCAAMCAALEPVAEAYCVADAGELRQLRRFSPKQAIVLGAVALSDIAAVLDLDGVPTVSSVEEVDAAAAWARAKGQPPFLRVGLLPAAGWSGLTPEALAALAPTLVRADASVELWTHVTNLAEMGEHVRAFATAVEGARGRGLRIVGTEVASTAPLATAGALGSSVRVGIGLFGSGKAALPAVACALEIAAPIVRIERHSAGTRVGYGAVTLEREEELAVIRCGYADGLPQSLGGAGDFLSVGMQYATVRSARARTGRTAISILDASSDLDEFARLAGRSPHEVVTAFGNAARALEARKER